MTNGVAMTLAQRIGQLAREQELTQLSGLLVNLTGGSKNISGASRAESVGQLLHHKRSFSYRVTPWGSAAEKVKRQTACLLMSMAGRTGCSRRRTCH